MTWNPVQTKTESGNEVTINDRSNLDNWRSAKKAIDDAESLEAILGCVGEPLLAHLDAESPAVREAARQAASNLLDLVNEQRDKAYDSAWDDAEAIAEYAANNLGDCLDEISASSTLEEVAQIGASEVESHLSNDRGYVRDLTLEDLY